MHVILIDVIILNGEKGRYFSCIVELWHILHDFGRKLHMLDHFHQQKTRIFCQSYLSSFFSCCFETIKGFTLLLLKNKIQISNFRQILPLFWQKWHILDHLYQPEMGIVY